MRQRRDARLFAALAVSLLSLLDVGSASALIVPRPHGRTVSYQPVPAREEERSRRLTLSSTTSTTNGAPVMASNTNYAVYWAPSGSGAPLRIARLPSDYQPGLNQFFSDLAHDSGGTENVDSVATQYNDAAGEHAGYNSHFGGDRGHRPLPGERLRGGKNLPFRLPDPAELVSYLKAQKLPMDLAHEYSCCCPREWKAALAAETPYCSAGFEPHEREEFCAYHGAEQLAGSAGVIVFSNDPYVAGGICDDGNHPNGSTADATISGGLSHEHNESLTDPEPNNAWTDWASGGDTGYEDGDKCRTFSPESEFGTPSGHGARRCEIQPGDQRPLLLVSAGVEQPGPHLPAATRAAG